MGAFVFIIILLLVIVPRMRQESVRRTPYGKEHRGTQYGYRAAGKGGAQVQPAQYSYPAGAQAQGAAGTGGALVVQVHSVDGVYALPYAALQETRQAGGLAASQLAAAVLHWENRSVTLLDADRLTKAMLRSLA